MKWIVSLCSMALIVALIGCASVDSLSRDQAGTTQIFENRSLSDVFEAAAEVVPRELKPIEIDRSKGTIKAESKLSDRGFGEIVAVYVYELNSGDIELKVITQKKLNTQTTKKDWGSIIIEAVIWELND